MIGDLRINKIDYSLLAGVSAAYMLFFILYQSDNVKIFSSTVIYAIFYVLWGIFHHIRIKNLRFKIMLEYLLVATFGLIVASSLLI